MTSSLPPGLVLIFGGLAFSVLCFLFRRNPASLRRLERRNRWLRHVTHLRPIPGDVYINRVRTTFLFLMLLGLLMAAFGIAVVARG